MNLLTGLIYTVVYISVYLAADVIIGPLVSLGVPSFAATIIYYAAVIFIFYVLTYGNKLNVKYGFHLGTMHIINIFSAIILAAGLVAATIFASSSSLFSQYTFRYTTAVSDIYNKTTAEIILTVCILTPLFEELMFRGVILGELDKCMPFHIANILQSLIFAFLHGNIIQGFYTFIAGLSFGLVYKRTKSIYMPMLVHVLFNTASFLLYRFNIVLRLHEIAAAIIALVLTVSGVYLSQRKGGNF